MVARLFSTIRCSPLLLCVIILLSFGHRVVSESTYLMGNQGESCTQACMRKGLNCNPAIKTGNNPDIFKQLGVSCTPDPTVWWAENQPNFVVNKTDPNYGKCLGYMNVPGGVLCAGAYPTVQRLCRCDEPSSDPVFGTGLSSGSITLEEQFVFGRVLPPHSSGVMTHFWTTYRTDVDDGVIIRYYVDGETTASIEFTPSLACGVGSYDPQAPWGTKWFGKGAADGGWFWNFRVPFQKSILVTTQHKYGNHGGFYMIVRGGLNIPFNIGGVTIPPTARLVQNTTDATFQPLDWVTLASMPPGYSGIFFMHTLAVVSGNPNFLEGCYHWYSAGQEFPGTLLSTGTEDMFSSAWYFNAGEFHSPETGFTHMNLTNGVSFSAYRFEEMDPMQFINGFSLVWRNGDATDAAGIKCMIPDDSGHTVGSPTPSKVTAYAWSYVW